jgi:hypothetical protein
VGKGGQRAVFVQRATLKALPDRAAVLQPLGQKLPQRDRTGCGGRAIDFDFECAEERLGFRTAIVPLGSNFLFASTATSPGQVVKFLLGSGGTVTRVAAVAANQGEDSLRAGVVYNMLGFYATYTSPGYIVKFNLTSMTRLAAYQTSVDDFNFAAAASSGDIGYFASGSSPGRLLQFDLNSSVIMNVASGIGGETTFACVVLQGDFAYVCCALSIDPKVKEEGRLHSAWPVA